MIEHSVIHSWPRPATFSLAYPPFCSVRFCPSRRKYFGPTWESLEKFTKEKRCSRRITSAMTSPCIIDSRRREQLRASYKGSTPPGNHRSATTPSQPTVIQDQLILSRVLFSVLIGTFLLSMVTIRPSPAFDILPITFLYSVLEMPRLLLLLLLLRIKSCF